MGHNQIFGLVILVIAIFLSFYTQREQSPKWPLYAGACALLYAVAFYLLH